MAERQTLVSRERLIYKSWLDKAILRGIQPPAEAAEFVRELLTIYAEAGPDLESSASDIYATAHDLAALTLDDMPVDLVNTVYRDYLLDAMVDSATKCSCNETRSLVRFTNLISSAFCDAHSDQLRKTIRRDRVQRSSAEMKMAKEIQRRLLPKVIPKIPGYQFAGRLIPASEVGGDYWSVRHYAEDGIVTMKLADISGHGVAAATLVAAVKFISGCYYRRSSSAAEVMQHTNRVLTIETPHDILISMAYGWLCPESHKLSIVNAGHDPVFFCHEGACIDVAPTGPVLGVLETVEYEETAFDLQEGDIIFFGSDGIIEAGIGQPFGRERLKDVLVSSIHLSADEIADTVVKAVRDYAPVPHDDISLLVTKVTSDSSV
jgi:hypothetical protein